MSAEIAVKVSHIGKTFHENQGAGSFKSAFVSLGKKITGKKEKKIHKGEYTALKDISFEIKKGEFFGIVGRNGCGKSTLLKIIAGVYTPTKGAIHVNGTLTPFIELGVGFNPELSGRDNVFLNGALLGFTRKQMEDMYDDIVEFAELKDFMDMKLKNYSSGMQVRLAFSVAIRAESDVLLIDEVLAVGDEAFQKKCYDYFEKLKEDNKTVILVTHDMSAVEQYCNRAVLIEKGNVTEDGEPELVANSYKRIFDSTIPKYGTKEYVDLKQDNNHKYESNIKRIGNKTAIFENVTIAKNIFSKSEDIIINFSISANTKSSKNLLFAYAVKSKENQVLFGNKYPIKINNMKTSQNAIYSVSFPNILFEGSYNVDLSLFDIAKKDYAEIWYDSLGFQSDIKGGQGFSLITDSKFKENL